MLNAASLAAGVATGIAAEQGNKFIRGISPEIDNADPDMLDLLKQIRDLLLVQAHKLSEVTPNENDSTPIYAYPAQYRVPQYNRPHFCMFVGSGFGGSAGAYTPTVTSAKFYFEIPGVGTHIKTLTPGWNQLDLPPQTAISTADGNTYNVIISFRDDAIGTAL